MRKTLMLLSVILISTFAISAQQVFVASLTGAQEVPANASTAKGTCKIVLNAAETQVSVSCTYSGLGTNLTAGHTHGASAIGVNSGVLFNYAPPTGSTSGSFNAGPFNVTAQNVADMRAHRHYSNLHTTGFPGGEIRGQIKQANLVFDGDGDGRTDAVAFRQSTNEFWTNRSNGGFTIQSHGTGASDNWLNNLGDFDGDGIADLTLIKLGVGNIANWNILQSSTNTIRSVDWGDFTAAPGTVDQLVPADYDGDGIWDVAVYRRSTGTWWIIRSTDGARPAIRWGASGAATPDFGVSGDFDGDGKSDLTAVRVEGGNRVWYTLRSSNGTESRTIFGASTDAFFFFAPFDIDGDGKQDLLINRTVSAQRQFHYLRSSDGGYGVATWGTTTAPASVAVFGDYDGDGKTDFTAKRSNGTNFVWETLRSSDGGISYITWGLPTDQIVAENPNIDAEMQRRWEMADDMVSNALTRRK
ncbi:MAG TPA: CHRD domain-containing protein [Pyrinomonadaceae bacterium]|nr:CHRD domain-containing protein [Pyrinomonadaceae bacterium]